MPEPCLDAEALRNLSRQNVGCCRWNEPLSRHSWWRIGGLADLFIEPQTIPQVQIVRRSLTTLNLPYVVIGDGSNLLFADQGVRGVVVRIGRALSKYTIEGERIIAEAGIFVPRLARNVGKAGLSGLEHVIGIPGSLGGLVLMNGGSQRQGVGSSVKQVLAINSAGEIVKYSNTQCRFSYRASALQNENVIVVEVSLNCSKGSAHAICHDMLSILRSRRNKFPLNLPNCGSVFISDPAMYSTVGPPGKVIEDCGLKGVRIGDAMVSEKHANFIVNLGQARSAEVLSIIQKVRETVHERTGFWLVSEVRYVSPAAEVMAAHEAK